MRILWAVNIIPKEAALHLNATASVLGGWIESMAAQLSVTEGVTLAMACRNEGGRPFEQEISGIRYYDLTYSRRTKASALRDRCGAVIDSFKPDIIHIEGTEFSHAYAMLAAGKERGIPTVVSLQGILNGSYNYQCGQLPVDDMMFSASVTNIAAAWIMRLRKVVWYKPRMKREAKLLSEADCFLGRTTWDRAHSYSLNPNARYYTCNRILRKPFYSSQWREQAMTPHTIYVGNGYFALKGLHFLLMALPQLIREYPDVRVYIAGHKPYGDGDSRAIYKRGYAMYLKKLVRDLKIEEHIEFTGPLSAEQVAQKLTEVNAYVLCSVVENSPNTLAEAMLTGTPCAAAYVGGVADMAKDGVEALFFRNDDPAMLAWTIKRIFDDRDLALKLSCAARKRAAVTHDPRENLHSLLSAYADILSPEEKL